MGDIWICEETCDIIPLNPKIISFIGGKKDEKEFGIVTFGCCAFTTHGLWGGGKEVSGNSDSSSVSSQVEDTLADDSIEEVKNDAEDSISSTENDSTEESATEHVESSIVFEETVAVDDEICMIKITKFLPDSSRKDRCILNAEFENKSAEKDINVQIDTAVNGVQYSTSFITNTGLSNVFQLGAGQKADSQIDLHCGYAENEIGDFTDIELTFYVMESESSAKILEKTIHIFPYGEDKAVSFVREEQPSDYVIIDDEYVTAIITGYEEISDYNSSYSVNLFLENKTDEDVCFIVKNSYLNGIEAKGSLLCTGDWVYGIVKSGRSDFGEIYWSADKLEEIGISEVEEIEIELGVFADILGMDEISNGVITLNP